MTRKHLPKAIRRTTEDLREIAVAAVSDEETPASQSAAPRAPAVAQPALVISSRPAANDAQPSASVRAQWLAARRRSLARKIVERHKTYAAVGGLLPLPIVNIASVTAIIVRMVKQLSELYQVPFDRDRTRSIVIGLVGGAVPTGLGAATTSTLAFAVPGSAVFGLAVSAITAGAVTRGIGLVFVEHFETAAMPLGVAASKTA